MKCQAQEHERNYGLGMDALIIVCSWNTNVMMVWAWMLWSSHALRTEDKRSYGLGMDALVIECSWNTSGIMVWAWMLWSSYALRAAPHGGNAFLAHRPWSITSCKGIFSEAPNAGSTRLRPTKSKTLIIPRRTLKT